MQGPSLRLWEAAPIEPLPHRALGDIPAGRREQAIAKPTAEWRRGTSPRVREQNAHRSMTSATLGTSPGMRGTARADCAARLSWGDHPRRPSRAARVSISRDHPPAAGSR